MKIIEQFLEKVDPKDKGVQQALGLTEREMEVFWAALNTVGDDLAIPNFTKVAGKLVKTPSPYIDKIKKAKLVVRGEGKGKWGIADGAIKKMEAIMKGETSAPAAEPKARRTRKRRKGGEKKPLAAKTAPATPTDPSIGVLREKIASLNEQIAALEVERGVVALQLLRVMGEIK